MAATRTDTDLLERFEALSSRGTVRITSGSDGWEVTVVLRLDPRPIVCTSDDLLESVVEALNKVAARDTSLGALLPTKPWVPAAPARKP
jgi:hypothetical protein